MDLNNLPKEVLFTLFLHIKRKEFQTICLSKNSKIRQVCDSAYFQEAYKQKYPRFKLFIMDNSRPLVLPTEPNFFKRIVQHTFSENY